MSLINHALHATITHSAEHDAIVISKRNDPSLLSEATDHELRKLTVAKGSRSQPGCTQPAPDSWVFERDHDNNIAYFDENRANVVMTGHVANTITTVDVGLVVYNNVSDVEVVRFGSDTILFSSARIGDAIDKMVSILRSRNLVYRRPAHLLQRYTPPSLPQGEFAVLLNDYFGWRTQAITPLPGGKGRTVFLVASPDGRRAVLKLIGTDPTQVHVLVNLQRSSDVFPRLYPLVSHDDTTLGAFAIRIGTCYYVLEEFLTADHPPNIDADYYFRFGRNLGSFHNQMQEIQSSISVDIAGLRTTSLPPNLVDVMLLDLRVAHSKLSVTSSRHTASSDFLSKNYEFLVSQLHALKASDYIRAFNSLPKQIVHGDISVLHSFINESESMRLIDLETMCFTSRTYEFPIALIGRGAGNASIYIPGSFGNIVRGYNETARQPLTTDEVEIIKLLIQHRFFHMLQVWIVRYPIHDARRLALTLESMRLFLQENPVHTRVLRQPRLALQPPTAVPFLLPKHLSLLSTDWIGEKDTATITKVSERLQRNLYFVHAPPDLRAQLPGRIAALSQLPSAVLDFVASRYPTLQVKSVSLFGSYMYSERPHDIDVLVIVDGSHYSLDTVPFDRAEMAPSKDVPSSVEAVGISIKGEANLADITCLPSLAVSEESQKPVLERTVAALFDRHVTLYGFDFKESTEVLPPNLLAEASDLLINVYHRYYTPNPKTNLTELGRGDKVLSRLYEAAMYLCSAAPDFPVTPTDVRNRWALFSSGTMDFEAVKRFYRYFVAEYEMVVSARRRTAEAQATAPVRVLSQEPTSGDVKQMKALLNHARMLVRDGSLGTFLPVVARIVDASDHVIASGCRVKHQRPTDYGIHAVHAEMDAIERAKAVGFSDWGRATLYTTLEPCYWCTRALSESYGFHRIIYALEDLTLPEYLENRETCAREGIELRQIVDASVRAEALGLFQSLRTRDRYGSELHREVIQQRQDLTHRFNEMYSSVAGQQIQSEYFDADTMFVADGRLRFWLSHLEHFQRNRNREYPHILLVGGSDGHRAAALKQIYQDGVYNGRILYVESGCDFEIQDARWVARGVEAFIFDYDNTLVDADEILPRESADALARLLIAGNVVAIASSRSMDHFVADGGDVPGMIMAACQRIAVEATWADKSQWMSNFVLFCDHGASKYRFVLIDGRIEPIADRFYGIVLSPEAQIAIRQAVEQFILIEHGLAPGEPLVSTQDIGVTGTDRVVSIRVQFKRSAEAPSKVYRLTKFLEAQTSRDLWLTEGVSIVAFEHSLSINSASKERAISHLAEGMGLQRIHFFGDDPAGTDAEAFRPPTLPRTCTFEAICVGTPQHTLSTLSSMNMDDSTYGSGWNPLLILKRPRARRYLERRLSVYWSAAGLPQEWIEGITEILSEEVESPLEALVRVFRAFPDLSDELSSFRLQLRAFRASKVRILAQRISPFVVGGVFLDVGGRAQDLAIAVLNARIGVTAAYVTDITQFKEGAADPRIQLVWQSAGDAIALPEESVDTALLSMVLHHIDRKTRRRLISQITKLVKPRGRILVIEDSCPKSSSRISRIDPFTAPILEFDEDERFQVLAFLDWFGNTVTRKRTEFAYRLTYETMEYWEALFESFGYLTQHSEFVLFDKDRLDLMPPKAFMVFERELVAGG